MSFEVSKYHLLRTDKTCCEFDLELLVAREIQLHLNLHPAK